MGRSPLSQPHPELNSRTYPYHYSASIVDSFIEKYGRATIFVAKKLYLTPMAFRNSLIKTFQERNAKWNVLREVIKRIQIQNMYPELGALERMDFIHYLTAVSTLVVDDLLISENLRNFG